jgi:hypothetical protein
MTQSTPDCLTTAVADDERLIPRKGRMMSDGSGSIMALDMNAPSGREEAQ